MGLMRSLVRLIVMIVRFLLPILVRAVWLSAQAAAVALIATFKGWPESAKKMANHWVGEAINRGVPTEWHKYIYRAGIVIAYLVLVFGWIVASYLTVWIVNRLF